jgi:hypothetical protein
MLLTDAVGNHANFVFFGEAGCGKSEIAVNLALALAAKGDRPVRFFDLDMTKPLFRSRDAAETLTGAGVELRFEAQFMDAPTQVGGPAVALRDADCWTILDVGGDYVGAGAVGMYAPALQSTDTAAFYVVNSFRPWSMTPEHIDGVLGQVLGAAKLPLAAMTFIGNPNLGVATTRDDVREGLARLKATLGPYVSIPFACVRDTLWPMEDAEISLVPIQLYLTYPWEQTN